MATAKSPILVTTIDVNHDPILRTRMLADEQNTLIEDIKSELSRLTPNDTNPHFIKAIPLNRAQSETVQHVGMDLLRIHCTMGYQYMALLHIELLLEYHNVPHPTATPLNHLLSLLAEHIDVADGHYCQGCKWRTNLRRCSACKWCYYCSRICMRTNRKHHKRTVCTKLIGRQVTDLNTARELEVMAQRSGFGGWRPAAVLLCASVLDDPEATKWWQAQHIDRGGDVLLTSMLAVAHKEGLLYAFVVSRNQLLRDRYQPPAIWYKPNSRNDAMYRHNSLHRTPQFIIHADNTVQSLCNLVPTHGRWYRKLMIRASGPQQYGGVVHGSSAVPNEKHGTSI